MKTNSPKTNRKTRLAYITQLARRNAMSNSQIIMMMLAGLVLVMLQSSPVRAQWTNGNNINNTNTGNVGIGTTNPTEKLEVNGTVKSSGLTVTGAPAEPSYVNGLFLGMNGNTATINAVDQMVDFRDLVISNKSFQVKSWNGSGLVTGLFQNNAGNVGIGTTSPNTNLVGAFSYPASVKLVQLDSTQPRLIVRGSYDSGIDLIGASGAVKWMQLYNYNGITKFRSVDDSLNVKDVLVMDNSTGNVGIGTSTPASNIAGVPLYPGKVLQLQNTGNRAALIIQSDTTSAELTLSQSGAATNQKLFIVRNDGQLKFLPHTDDGSAAIVSLVVDSYANGGNVGIGTSTPATKLHVVGDGTITGNLTVTGNIAAKYQDVAEWVKSSQALAAGTIVVLDQTKSNQVVASSQAYDTRVAGVISAQPGIVLGESGANKVLVATTGRVLVKVDAGNGPIRVGDLLVTSDTPGTAMKSEPIKVGGRLMHMPGTLIGKALEPLEKGSGKILVLLSLQ